jgi:hypothetical protein
MAKVHEEIVIIKFSRLIKDSENAAPVVTDDVVSSLVQISEELVGSGVVVELINEAQ